jgi:hypothetical protein
MGEFCEIIYKVMTAVLNVSFQTHLKLYKISMISIKLNWICLIECNLSKWLNKLFESEQKETFVIHGSESIHVLLVDTYL